MRQSKTIEIDHYIEACPKELKPLIETLRTTILEACPDGFEETFQYHMIGYVIPFETYPDGYHANPKEPFPLMHLGYQKHHVALYYMGFYRHDVRTWFVDSYTKQFGQKPDLGKSCLRFKKSDQLSTDLLKTLLSKVDLETYLEFIDSLKRK